MADTLLKPLIYLFTKSGSPCGEKLRSMIDGQPFPPARRGASAQTAAFFKNDHIATGSAKIHGSFKPGDSRTDDQNISFL